MAKQAKAGKGRYHFLMTLLVTSWGLEYALAKDALAVIDPVTLMTFKYVIGIGAVALILAFTSGFQKLRRQDLLLVVLCSLFGEVMYFFCEYKAMDTLPVAVITIVLGFVPVLSIIVERLLFKRRPSGMLVLFMCINIAGIVLTIGGGISMPTGGKVVGYFFCLGAMASWVCYNFLTDKIASSYSAILVAFYQMVFACLMTLPYSLCHLPDPVQLTSRVILEVVYLGLASAGFGFLAYVIGIKNLGPTIASIYSNFLPVTTAIFGVLLLGQELSLLQIIGGIVVIAAGLFVIREKARLELLRLRAQTRQ
ncbi:MAG: DMT family transporter [Anaerovoracaceae bacterium]|jgi:drug/metabolite transporter (DMT)-like permease